MVRWIGLALLLLSMPLFVMIRDGPYQIQSARLRVRLGICLFMIGFSGFCLLFFGGVREAAIFLLLWGFIACAYNL